MVDGERLDVRTEILHLLVKKVASDKHPSGGMLNQIEQLLKTPDDIELYVGVLMDKVQTDRYPSIDMMNRLLRLGG